MDIFVKKSFYCRIWKMFERNESGADLTSEDIVASSTGRKQKAAFNWPYDFFSLVELIKLDVGIELGNVDEGETSQFGIAQAEPTEPTRRED